MHPHQKYPSAYKAYPQYPESAVPQTPFDMAYGSSLLPHQLLVSSPFVQVASPLPSPGHHHFPYHRGPGSVSIQAAPSYIMAPPPPKLSLPPESRKRGLKHQQHQKQHAKQQDEMETPSKAKYKSISSSTSSLDESTFDIQINRFGRNISSASAEDQAELYANSANQSSTSSLYQLQYNQSLTQVNGGTFQLSKLPTRCILLASVDPEASLTSILDYIPFGPLESARLVENYPEENMNSVCLTFLKMDTCLDFYNNLLSYLSRFKKLINSPDLAISFVVSKKVLPFISYAINNDGATRNVYAGDLQALNKPITKKFLHTEFSKFGLIEKIDLVQKPNGKKHGDDEDNEESSSTTNREDQKKEIEIFAFIHFTSIAFAIKAVEQLSLNTEWHPCKIFYGTDRCSMQTDTFVKSMTDEGPSEEDENTSTRFFDSGYIREDDEDDGRSTVQYFYPPQHFPHSEEDVTVALNQKSAAVMAVASTAGGAHNIGNRTICLANLEPKTKVEDICNVVRGGILQSIKYLPEKKLAFLTFVEPAAAAQFFANANINPMILHGKRVKVGWGKHSGPLPTHIALAVTVGASRNLYLGIKEEDLENPKEQLPDEETLRKDFSLFGEIEQVNFFKQNRCVFLNFYNISTAIKVVDDANGANADDFHEQFVGKYRNFKISFGKDRCGNPPKAKKKKNRKKRMVRQANDEIDSKTVEVEEVSAELFSGMGITSTLDDENGDGDEQGVEQPETNAFGITSDGNGAKKTGNGHSTKSRDMGIDGGKDYEISDCLSISSSDSSSGEIIFTKPSSNSFKPQRNTSEPTGHKPSNRSHTQQNSRHKKSQSFTPSVGSRVSSYSSLNSLYHGRESENPVYYKSVPFAPPAAMVPGRSGFTTPVHHQQHAFHKQMAPAHFSTNGSQVMAQYLAQSQHANMVYAANVLNSADLNYFEDEYGNAYRRTGRVRRS